MARKWSVESVHFLYSRNSTYFHTANSPLTSIIFYRSGTTHRRSYRRSRKAVPDPAWTKRNPLPRKYTCYFYSDSLLLFLLILLPSCSPVCYCTSDVSFVLPRAPDAITCSFRGDLSSTPPPSMPASTPTYTPRSTPLPTPFSTPFLTYSTVWSLYQSTSSTASPTSPYPLLLASLLFPLLLNYIIESHATTSPTSTPPSIPTHTPLYDRIYSITHLTVPEKERLSEELQSTLEGWYGGELELTSIYGIRYPLLLSFKSTVTSMMTSYFVESRFITYCHNLSYFVLCCLVFSSPILPLITKSHLV